MLVALPAVVGIEDTADFRIVEIARIKVAHLRRCRIEAQLVHVAIASVWLERAPCQTRVFQT